MKYSKILLLIIFALFLTGCDVTYNLEITNDYMTESVDFWYDDTSENESIIDQYLAVDHQAYFDMDLGTNYNYTQKKITDDDRIGMNLRYNYSGDNLQNSSLIDRCYYQKSVMVTDEEIVLYTDGKTSCLYMDDNKLFDSLTINIKTDLPVIENNADEVDGNTYTWIIDENNYQNHPINLRISRNVEDDGFNYWLIIIIVCAISVIVFVALGIIYIKNRKNNKI